MPDRLPTEGVEIKPGPKPSGIVEARARDMAEKLAGQRAARAMRNLLILCRVAAGEAQLDIACDHGLTTARVWQITHGWQSRRTDR